MRHLAVSRSSFRDFSRAKRVRRLCKAPGRSFPPSGSASIFRVGSPEVKYFKIYPALGEPWYVSITGAIKAYVKKQTIYSTKPQPKDGAANETGSPGCCCG
jgi:hypothetical protein